MRLSVKLFARARDLAGASQIELEVPDQATVGDLRLALTRNFPALAPLSPILLIAVGTDYADDEMRLPPAADVACFPPVSGG